MQDRWSQGSQSETVIGIGHGETLEFPVANLWRFRDGQELLGTWDMLFGEIAIRYDLDRQLCPQYERFLHEKGVWLASNALDSIQDKAEGIPATAFKPRVDINITQQDGRLRLEVEDNGKGLTPEVEARLFTPFSSTKIGGTRYGQCGNGLAIIRGQAEEMNGAGEPKKVTYGYRNKGINQGAAFWIEVPYGRAPARR